MESLWDMLRPEMQEEWDTHFFYQKHMQWLNRVDDEFWLKEII